jgi:histidinol-phosphate/aromatic aminotransferase/cobyric acid decarboxylase-like protein
MGDAGRRSGAVIGDRALAKATRAARELTAISFFAVAAGVAVSSAQSKRVGASKKATAIVVIIRVPNLIVAS